MMMRQQRDNLRLSADLRTGRLGGVIHEITKQTHCKISLKFQSLVSIWTSIALGTVPSSPRRCLQAQKLVMGLVERALDAVSAKELGS